MSLFLIAFVSALAQARSFILPIAPSFRPKRFSADELEDGYGISLSNSASISTSVFPGVGTVVGGIFGSGRSPRKVGGGVGSAIFPGVGTVVGGIFGSGRHAVSGSNYYTYDAQEVDDKIKLGHILKHLVPLVLAYDEFDNLQFAVEDLENGYGSSSGYSIDSRGRINRSILQTSVHESQISPSHSNLQSQVSQFASRLSPSGSNRNTPSYSSQQSSRSGYDLISRQVQQVSRNNEQFSIDSSSRNLQSMTRQLASRLY